MKDWLRTFQALYDSEINFAVSTFWDGGFDWKLGDDMNGFVAEGKAHTMEAAAHQLHRAAVEKYPDSKYTMNCD